VHDYYGLISLTDRLALDRWCARMPPGRRGLRLHFTENNKACKAGAMSEKE
jgi:hypothetical protein